MTTGWCPGAADAPRPCKSRILVTGFVLLSVALWSSPAAALDPGREIHQYKHNNWSIEDGLPQSSVYSITQTKDGYIWFGTLSGLARFDGVKFSVFNKENTPAFSGNLMSPLLADPDGSLWIGERSTGVVHYHNGEFTRLPALSESSSASVTALARHEDGRLWMGTSDALYVLENQRLSPVELPQEFASNGITALFAHGDGTLWIGGGQGDILTLTQDQDGTSIQPLDSVGSRATVIIVDEAGATWIGTLGHGLVRLFDGQRDVFTTLDGLSDNYIRSLVEDGDGNLWIGTVSGGLCRRRGQQICRFDATDGLSGNVIHALFEDHEGSLWVGTNEGGVDLLSDSRIVPFTTADGLSGESVFGVLQDRQGRIWVGTQGSGINYYKNGRFENIDTEDGLSHDAVLSIAQGPDGDLWLGTYGGGVNRLLEDDVRVYGAAEGLDDPYILALFFDDDRSLWVGAENSVFKLEDSTFQPVLDLPARVSAILQDARGVLWVGTSGTGIRLLEDGEVEVIDTEQGLTNNIVSSLYEDRRGWVWIGTMEGGLNRWFEGEIRSLDQKAGLPDNSIYCVTGDGDGNLWMSSNRGIIGLASHQLEAYFAGQIDQVEPLLLGMSDNMKSLEGNGGTQPCAWMTDDGRIWFPTTKGIAAVEPPQGQTLTEPPPVVIESIFADGESIDVGDTTAILYGNHRLNIGYSALSYVAVEKIRFRYKMVGFDDEWIEAGTQRSAQYTNLDPGDYVFRVIACDRDGVWSELGADAPITIQPRFHQTRLFIALCVASVLLIGLLFELVRQRRQRQREDHMKRRIEAALAQVQTLSGLLPICANCKKIRDDEGYWEQIETFIGDRSEAEFSHGICPTCVEALYPDFADTEDGEN